MERGTSRAKCLAKNTTKLLPDYTGSNPLNIKNRTSSIKRNEEKLIVGFDDEPSRMNPLQFCVIKLLKQKMWEKIENDPLKHKNESQKGLTGMITDSCQAASSTRIPHYFPQKYDWCLHAVFRTK